MSPFSLANLKCYLKIAEIFHSHENVLCLHTPIHTKKGRPRNMRPKEALIDNKNGRKENHKFHPTKLCDKIVDIF